MTRFSRTTALALASVSMLALTAAARAQPVHTWAGFYVGVNAGYAWGRSDANTAVDCSQPFVGGGGYFCAPGIPGVGAQVAAAGTGSLSGDGFTGGVQAGYNWQSQNLVYGVELDFGAFDIGASRSVTAPYGPAFPPGAFTITNAIDTDWLFTARGRIGWAVNNLLIYATGGIAVTQIETNHSFIDTFGTPVGGTWGASDTKLGWTIGAGFEWALGGNWSIKAEYLYLDFGSVGAAGRLDQITVPGAYNQGISTSVDVTAHIARAGVNFRF